MKKKLKEISQNKFLRNVSTLAVGTIVSQAIVVLASLLLARIYGSAAFGVLSLFTGLATIMAVPSTGRYEYSVILPEKDSDGKAIVYLIGTIGLTFSGIYMLAILLLRNFSLGKYSELFHSDIIFLLPLYIFFVAVFSSLQYWTHRKRDYKTVSKTNMLQSLTNVFVSVVLGIFIVKYGLVFGLASAVFVCIVWLVYKNRELLKVPAKGDIVAVAKRYVSFPKYMLVSDLSVTFNQQMIPIIFSSIFTSSIVGYYAMANRMLRLPTIVLTTSISDVFRNEALERIKQNGNCTSLYKKTISKLVMIALPTFIIIYLLSPFALELVLGKSWLPSAEFAQILCIMLFFEFIATPLNSLFYIFEKQKYFMTIQSVSSLVGILLIYWSYRQFHSAKLTLLFFSMSSAVFNMICLNFTYKLSKKSL